MLIKPLRTALLKFSCLTRQFGSSAFLAQMFGPLRVTRGRHAHFTPRTPRNRADKTMLEELASASNLGLVRDMAPAANEHDLETDAAPCAPSQVNAGDDRRSLPLFSAGEQ